MNVSMERAVLVNVTCVDHKNGGGGETQVASVMIDVDNIQVVAPNANAVQATNK